MMSTTKDIIKKVATEKEEAAAAKREQYIRKAIGHVDHHQERVDKAKARLKAEEKGLSKAKKELRDLEKLSDAEIDERAKSEAFEFSGVGSFTVTIGEDTFSGGSLDFSGHRWRS
jgi:predicted translin family RNA/ssDNA-binding protein